jgi:excisionase family DNA binding protein
MKTEQNIILGSGKLADQLGVHRVTVQRWIRDGKLEAKKIGSFHIFDPDQVTRDIKKMKRK